MIVKESGLDTVCPRGTYYISDSHGVINKYGSTYGGTLWPLPNTVSINTMLLNTDVTYFCRN